jgi:hypothetical protein
MKKFLSLPGGQRRRRQKRHHRISHSLCGVHYSQIAPNAYRIPPSSLVSKCQRPDAVIIAKMVPCFLRSNYRKYASDVGEFTSLSRESRVASRASRVVRRASRKSKRTHREYSKEFTSHLKIRLDVIPRSTPLARKQRVSQQRFLIFIFIQN